jgi:hypothetical protein
MNDLNKTYIGVIEDNLDPKKLGRCRVRVLNVYDDIPTEHLPWATPWKDLNGNSAIIPDKGKVVTIIFNDENIYKPEYIYADHYNVNLEKKLQELSDSDYSSMKALMFDHKTQIYSNDSEGLKMDYKLNNINITQNSIDINIKDNFSKVNIGSPIANQSAILGNHFLNWFDEFIENLLGSNGGPYLGNAGAPVIANPGFIDVILKYKALKDTKFLSKHVGIVDNEYVLKQERNADGQLGDSWKSTLKENEISTSEKVDFKSKNGISNDETTGIKTISEGSGQPSDQEPNNQEPVSISPTTNPDAIKIFDAMKKKGYRIYSKPYQLNIIGIRRQYEGMKYSNQFIDSCVVIYKKSEAEDWVIHTYKFTTIPGVYLGEERKDLKDHNGQVPFTPAGWKIYVDPKQPTAKAIQLNKTSHRFQVDRQGLGQIQPSQMIDKYYLSEYPKGTPALKDKGGLPVYRDKDKSDKIVYTTKGIGSDCYIHKSGPNRTIVNNYSEGCQVFADDGEFNHFISLCEKHKKAHGNAFTYTLIEERDI